MTAILLLCLPADRDRAMPIIDALVGANLDAHWFCAAPDDPEWTDAADAIETARCVIFWSQAAAAGEAVRYRLLAARVLARQAAIGITLDPGALTPELAWMTSYDLSGWRSRPGGLRRLLAGGIYMDDVVTAAKFKIAGRDPPPPSAPRKLLMRRAWLGFVSVAGFAALLGAIPQLYQSIPWPRFNEEAAWAKLRPGSCEDLLAFRKTWPSGGHAADAQARYDARRRVATIRWVRVVRSAPVTVPAGTAQALPTEAEARAAALARAKPEARLACEGFTRAAGSKLRGMRLNAGPLSCTRLAGGIICGMARGEAFARSTSPSNRYSSAATVEQPVIVSRTQYQQCSGWSENGL
jgi:hypothetical protein